MNDEYDTFISIQLSDVNSLNGVDFGFIGKIIGNIAFYIEKAKVYLFNAAVKKPPSFGYTSKEIQIHPDSNLVSAPSVIFYVGNEWSILFSEGVFPICEPYGILVNFYKCDIKGFEDISEAEEI